MKLSQRYSQLNQSEANTLQTLESQNGGLLSNRDHSWVWSSAYVLLGILAAVSCGVFGYVVAQHEIHPSFSTSKTSSTPERHCGNSSTEARALGCVFDLLTNNWMPERCYDSATDAEYREWVLDPARQLGAWAFYHDDKAAHQVASEEELSNLVGSHIYTTTENHLGHCTFLARRMHRLVTGDIAAVAHNPLVHTMHCTRAILRAVEGTEQPARADIGSTFDVGIVSC